MQDSTRFHFMNLALVAPVAAVLAVDPKTAIQLMALIGVVWLGTLLIIPRLLYSRHFARWNQELTRIAKLSKFVGLWVAGWFAAHGVAAVFIYYDSTRGLAGMLFSKPVVLGLLSLVVLLLLALISNKWSYANLRWWKHINMLVWAVPLLALAHSLIAAAAFRNSAPLLLAAPVILSIAALGGLSVVFSKQKKYMDYFRLAALAMSGAAALLVVFLWPG